MPSAKIGGGGATWQKVLPVPVSEKSSDLKTSGGSFVSISNSVKFCNPSSPPPSQARHMRHPQRGRSPYSTKSMMQQLKDTDLASPACSISR
jgi:hypothetical protein